ncbi:MAG: fatty acid desaturase [Endomicrobiales bacterium]|jgi:fatty acid desaturase
MNFVSTEDITKQKWKFYFVAAVWPLFLLITPWVFSKSMPVALIMMIFPGAYIFTWVGFLMHETWHKYVPELPNNLFYHLFSWMLLTDPQIYSMQHGSHHAQVNTWDDHEFHPLGKISHPFLRRTSNLIEIMTGIAFLVIVSSLTLPFRRQFSQKYRVTSLIVSLLFIASFLGSIALVAHVALHVSWHMIAIALVINFWIDSCMLHHSQMIEHGNLIVTGDWNQRNLKVRNLSAGGLLEKCFLFLTHGDSREHVLHHTLVSVYSRPFPGKVPMPDQAVFINLQEYVGILWRMVTEG